MKQFPEMWIPCSEREYPEVKQLLEGMGCKHYAMDSIGYNDLCRGVVVYSDGDFQPTWFNRFDYPTVTLPELRLMALHQKPQAIDDDLRLLKERVGIMERSIMGMESKINEIHKLLFEE